MSVIAYFDESGDDGVENYSSETFILTASYMHARDWNSNYEKIKFFRQQLKSKFGIPIKEEFHAARFFTDKNPYRKYNLSQEDKKRIVNIYAWAITNLNIKIINTVIDKKNISSKEYNVLSNALKYTIQRIENDSDWRYIIVSDKGRISIMRKTARALKCYNPITSMYSSEFYINTPIKNMIEDILEKDSAESYFIQISDFISFVVNLYYKYCLSNVNLPNRISSWLQKEDIIRLMDILKNVFNTKASSSNEYGLVIYPKIWQKKDTTLPSFEDGVVQ